MAMIPARPYFHFHIEKNRFLLYIYKVPLKIRLKTIKFTCLCVFTMVLSVCVQPVDVGSFMNNDRVVDQVEKGNVKVIIASGSDSGLVAGNRRISGLNQTKYYRVEELDDKNNVISTDFVTKTGVLDDLGKIGKASQITGLTNNVTYRVTSAKLFTKDIELYCFDISDTSHTNKASVTNEGIITFSQNNNTGKNYYFSLNDVIKSTDHYEVMKIPSTGNNDWTAAYTSAYRNTSGTINDPSTETNNYTKFNNALNIGIYRYEPDKYNNGTINPSVLANKSIAKLPEVDTTNDYVFVQYDNNKNIYNDYDSKDFFILTVIRKPEKGGATVNITSPGVPADATCNLVAGGTDSAKIDITNNGKDFIVTLTKPITAGTLTLTVNSTPSVNISAVNNGEGNAITSTTGLAFTAPNSGSNTITFTINTNNAPFDTLTALSGSYNIVVECVGNFSLPTIFIKVK
jgi:hypothetical protein